MDDANRHRPALGARNRRRRIAAEEFRAPFHDPQGRQNRARIAEAQIPGRGRDRFALIEDQPDRPRLVVACEAAPAPPALRVRNVQGRNGCEAPVRPTTGS